MKKLLLTLALILGVAGQAGAQFSIPRTFTVFTHLLAADVNLNFTTLADGVNRTGGIITGNITISDGVTLDGADISTYLVGGKLTALSAAADSIKVGGGITAGTGIVGIVNTTGKVPAVSSTFVANLDATGLTALDAAQLTGTITSATQDLITRTGTVVSGTWSATIGAVSGANLTSWNASNFTTGTVPPARLGTATPDSTTLLRGDGTWLALAGTSVPSNMVVFSNTGSCPTGFVEFTAARGMAIVGMPASGTSQGTVGSGLADLESRTHTHSIPGLTFTGPSFATSSGGGHVHDATSGGPSGTVTVVVDSLSGFTQSFTNVSTASHTHHVPEDGNGTHNHSGSVMNGGTTNTGTSGTANVGTVAPFIQMIACKKT